MCVVTIVKIFALSSKEKSIYKIRKNQYNLFFSFAIYKTSLDITRFFLFPYVIAIPEDLYNVSLSSSIFSKKMNSIIYTKNNEISLISNNI